MKTPLSVLLVCCFLFSGMLHAQSISTSAVQAKNLTAAANKFLEAFHSQQWNKYIDLSYPGIVKYYGGPKGYLTYNRYIRSSYNESSEKLRILQILNSGNEWQCVIEKTIETDTDNRKLKVISYLVGQSVDEGKTWQFADLAFNSIKNLNYIMPDIFDGLAVPQRSMIKESLASNDRDEVTKKN